MYWLPFLLAGLGVALIFNLRRMLGNHRAHAGIRPAPFPGAPAALAALLAMLVLTACVLARYAYRPG